MRRTFYVIRYRDRGVWKLGRTFATMRAAARYANRMAAEYETEILRVADHL